MSTRGVSRSFSFKEFTTCGGWSSGSKKVLRKIKSRIMGLEGNEPTFSHSDLRGLYAPQVPLKNSAELRVYSFTLR
ncbi:hypothetical protein Halhy_4469 [Haliscomenobacter hydrossis DSM 1100]|uniref:Uncharacterized protein n=1 Tax=Haliscomenobacter hydrossis (strain ATCC 27775 / DSM 1100 / LMG 10767 / O) TaxID=760192 RepID=F4KS65_HALH1|nr:hypothetical protein Halhy_4469 [Haliscomenobacter hydrossis DSM 1100]